MSRWGRASIIFLAAVLMVIYFPLAAKLKAEAQGELLTPAIHVLEKPKNSYSLSEAVVYKIQVSWPSESGLLRLQPPEINLKNLELAGVTQEAISETSAQTSAGAKAQVLTFQFRARQPGAAEISAFSLRWRSNNGVFSAVHSLPAVAFKIKKPFQPFWFAAGAGILLSGLALAVWVRKKSKAPLSQQVIPSDQISDEALSQLLEAFQSWKQTADAQSFLDAVTNAVDAYLSAKINWNRSHESYDLFLQKASKRWPDKEAKALCGLLKKFEFRKFSGGALNTEEVEQIYDGFNKFISEKKVIEIEEEKWKQPSSR